ncbi:MAG TPA: ATP-binding protein [Xanthomonadales bacterium]|nr:ATP-binding protein [Xanthomonadales bacterium]
MRRVSLEGRFALTLAGAATLGAGLAILLGGWLGFEAATFGIAVLVAVPLSMAFARLLVRPVTELFRTLSGAVASFRDGDFSFSIHRTRDDELGDLVTAHNELGRVLREERQNLFQRELLLHTVVQNTPNALVLVDVSDHIVYANTAARQLFNAGRKLEGLAFAQVRAESPRALDEAVASGQDGIFSVTLAGHDESFHLAQRGFQLNGRPHRLFLFKRMTRELSRQEVATWKKVIRVISHELNNSLAPISSLAHSGRELAASADPRLARVFDVIEERSRHLDNFIRSYATFAKLPSPRVERVELGPFVDGLRAHYPFVLTGVLPTRPVAFDPAQLSQVLINLLKNAHESGSTPDAVELEARDLGPELKLEVRDRGTGMSESVMTQALVPFYSTKRTGTGLGLALSREIVEAHGGRLSLANREGGGLTVAITPPHAPA